MTEPLFPPPLTQRDRAGKPLSGFVELLKIGSQVPQYFDVGDCGEMDLRLVPGTYSAMMWANVQGVNGPDVLGVALLGNPEVKVDKDATMVFYATWAHAQGDASDYAGLNVSGKAPVVRRSDSVTAAAAGSGRGGRRGEAAAAGFDTEGRPADGGATWQKAGLNRSEASWQTAVKAPESASRVSIGVTASDSKGNTATCGFPPMFRVRGRSSLIRYPA
ncbi:hypothetical protein ACIQCF_32490 [Streptomyces sp. NPDC088353]|uniref:hypothetical protein n=1 Tax=unclassified Streptomyces TaxID=2593676 RepID=UPI003690FDD8